ncbi:MAG TPA: M28 family peptidase, partial [Anaerolineales bacterium]
MSILSVPRPNGSPAERETRHALQAWLARRNIPHRTHTFRLHPYFFEPIGLWLIAACTLLAAAIWLRWGWPALIIALLSLAGGMLDVLGYPLITWLGARQGQNLLIEFSPVEARQEIILTAHYDSKTELLDHRQRMFFLLNIPRGIGLTIVLGLLGPLDRFLLAQGSPLAGLTFVAGIILTIPLLFLAWGLGLNLILGRFRPPSRGAVDNGAACAILLGLADRIAQGGLALRQTRLTLALFTGEEVNMQGSRAYARKRTWPMPAVAINLEVMAQNGEYVYWEQDGSSLKLMPCS